MPPIEPPMIEQHGLRAHHVADSDDGKFQAPRFAGCGIGRGRAGGAHAGADHVRTDHEVAVGVDRLAGPNHGFPPAGFFGHRMQVGHVLVAGERVAHQHRIGAIGIQGAIGLVSDLQRAELNAGIEFERPVRPKTGQRGVVRLVRLARCIRRLARAAQIGFDHIALRSRRAASLGNNASRVARRLGRWGLTVNLATDCQCFL
jgi:hypothetical protein